MLSASFFELHTHHASTKHATAEPAAAYVCAPSTAVVSAWSVAIRKTANVESAQPSAPATQMYCMMSSL